MRRPSSRPPSDILIVLVHRLHRAILVILPRPHPPSSSDPSSAGVYGSISALYSLYIGIADSTSIARVQACRYSIWDRPSAESLLVAPWQTPSAMSVPRVHHARCQFCCATSLPRTHMPAHQRINAGTSPSSSRPSSAGSMDPVALRPVPITIHNYL